MCYICYSCAFHKYHKIMDCFLFLICNVRILTEHRFYLLHIISNMYICINIIQYIKMFTYTSFSLNMFLLCVESDDNKRILSKKKKKILFISIEIGNIFWWIIFNGVNSFSISNESCSSLILNFSMLLSIYENEKIVSSKN